MFEIVGTTTAAAATVAATVVVAAAAAAAAAVVEVDFRDEPQALFHVPPRVIHWRLRAAFVTVLCSVDNIWMLH